jgi:hypothetical protein
MKLRRLNRNPVDSAGVEVTMTRLRGPLAVTAAVAFFLLSACARGTAGDSAAAGADVDAAAPAAPDDGLVIRVKHEGGFTSPDWLLARIPQISIYGDGRIITEGPQIMIYPGPALPNLQVQQIDPAKVDQLVGQALAAGVGSGTDLGTPGVADAPTTVIEVRTTKGVKTVSAVALNEAAPDDTSLTDPQKQARAKLAAFVKQLTDVDATDSQPYRPETLAAVVAVPMGKPAAGQPAAVAWPGPALPGESISDQLKIGCVSVTGAELDKVLAAAKKANQDTLWASGGKQYRLTFRPLLPDETGCADLKAAR